MTLSTKPPLKPRVCLTAFQYLCLKIATNPGQSSVWYLKQLNGYLEGPSSIINSYGFFFNDEHGVHGYETYFTNKYRGARWISSYTVTDKGMDAAKRAAVQIGLTLP